MDTESVVNDWPKKKCGLRRNPGPGRNTWTFIRLSSVWCHRRRNFKTPPDTFARPRKVARKRLSQFPRDSFVPSAWHEPNETPGAESVQRFHTCCLRYARTRVIVRCMIHFSPKLYELILTWLVAYAEKGHPGPWPTTKSFAKTYASLLESKRHFVRKEFEQYTAQLRVAVNRRLL